MFYCGSFQTLLSECYVASVMSDCAILWTAVYSVHGIIQNTGMGCHFLFQGIFLTQGLNLGLLHLLALAGRFFTTSTTWEPCSVR